MFKLAITGHADIEKANLIEEYPTEKNYDKKLYEKVYLEIDQMVKEVMRLNNLKKEDLVLISGMARGIDEIFALYAKDNNLPLILSIPNWLDWHKNHAPARQGSNIQGQAYHYDEILNYLYDRQKNGCKISKIFEIQKDYKSKSKKNPDEIFKYGYTARNQHMIDISDGMISYFKYISSGTQHALSNAIRDDKYIGNVSDFNGLKSLIKPLKIMYDTDLFEEKTHVLIQGCNCFNTMGAGVAKIIKDKYPEAYEADCETTKGDRNKLGSFSIAQVKPNEDKSIQKPLFIANAYTQYTYYDKNDMFYNDAFYSSITGIVDYFIEKRNNANKNSKIIFSFPAIGLGLANGKIEDIYDMLNNISKKYEKDNIDLKLCLIKNDVSLNQEFKNLEAKKKIIEKSAKKTNEKVIKNG